MMRPWFFCSGPNMWRDSWTYGNWAQYICNRPGGRTQCARFSTLPVFGLIFGVAILTVITLCISVASYDQLNWPGICILGMVAVLLCIPFGLGYFEGVYLMKAVGPYNKGASRVLPSEEFDR